MTNSKIIFGFTGPIASGKDTAADYLAKQYGGINYSYSAMLGDVLKRYHLEINRDNLIKISEAMREKFGEDILAKTMAKDVVDDQHKIISISNVRRIADTEHLREVPGFVLVSIDSDGETRYGRLTARGQRSDEKDKTYEQFVADQQRSTEVSILEVMKKATDHLDNNGTVEYLYKQLDALVKKYTE
ncbi:MAG: AAA family ATPase [bacterium]|nr:AAA family ATPase [bacterium]